MTPAPHIEKVKTAAILRLTEPTTDQCIVITAQGTDVAIAVSVAGGTQNTWAKCLREIADQIEDGISEGAEFIDECMPNKIVS